MEKISLEFRSQQVESLFEHGDSKFVQLSLEAGQGLTNHHTPKALTVVVLTGSVAFSVAEKQDTLRALELVRVEPGVEHAITAVERSTVLLILTPAESTNRTETPASAQPLEHENAYLNPQLLTQIAQELRPLVEDHIELCKMLDKVQQSPEEVTFKNALEDIAKELNRHFLIEEQVLFPRMAKHVGGMDVGPVARLLEEHKQIRKLHEEAESLLTAQHKHKDSHVWELLSAKMIELSRALLNHLGKEDSHMFPMASRTLTSEEIEAVSREMSAWS